MSSDNFPLSADAATIKASIRRRQLHEVYHYTPIAQVPGIMQHGGIHPRVVLREQGIPFNDDPARWSNIPEKAEALTGYVAVGVIRPWGMMNKDPDCVVFGIKADVLLRAGTAFIGGWSSRDEIRDLRDVEAREGIAGFNAMFDNPSTPWPSPIPGEVLVRGTIHEGDIAKLYVRDRKHLERVRQVLRASSVEKAPPYRTEVSPRLFPQPMRQEENL